MPKNFEVHNRVNQVTAINQPAQGLEAVSSGQVSARISTAQPSIVQGDANAPLGVNVLKGGRENLNGHGTLRIDPDVQHGILLDDSFGQTGATRAAVAAVERFPYTPEDLQARLTEVRELQNGLSREAKNVGIFLNSVSISGEPLHNNKSFANLLLPAELRARVEADFPPGTPGTVASKGEKTYRQTGNYYLHIAQARQEDLAAQEVRLVQQLQSNPTTQRALVERQSLSAKAGLDTLSSTLRKLEAATGATPPRVDNARIGSAEQLLTAARDAGHNIGTESALDKVFPGSAGQAGADHVARMQHRAMEHFLGVKNPSSSEQQAAVRQFLNEVDRYLEGSRTGGSETVDAPVLTGPDMTASSALTPDEKVSLVVARTLESAVAVNSLPPEGRALFKDFSNPGQVKKQVTENVRHELRNSFEPVVKRISVPIAERNDPSRPVLETYRATLIPASTVAARAGSPEAFGSTGVLSSDTHSPDHVPNMWITDYTSPEGKNIFLGVRHSTLSAFGINARSLKALPKQELHDLIRKTLPPERLAGRNIEQLGKQMTSRFSLAGRRLRNEARAQAAMNRAHKLVGFNLLHNKRAMDKIRSGADHIELELPSIMLFTPDRGRRILGALGMKPQYDELRMTREQDRALRELARQGGMQIPFKNTDGTTRNVTVAVKPMNFCFGVNKLAFNKFINTLSPSWGTADAISRSSVERLVGRDAEPGQSPTFGLVAEHLEELHQRGEGGGPEEATILQLADQVTRLWQSRAHHGQNNEPYALPARLALLTGKLGLTPGFNCKSGKDRTGQLDAEIKFLATQIERARGQVPEPGVELSSEEQDLYRTIVLNSGNHEIQRMNTGHAGYKVNLSSITRRLGGVLAQLQHIGQGR